ncbi:MAG: hypothetical protein J5879_04330 [Clostridia bacterium]|nr:hypothetical protein [Clostridia bacterium]
MNKSFVNWTMTARTDAVADAGGDFILPNDLPDVKRIVHCVTRINKSGCYSDGANLYADVNVTFMILYCGDDGKLYSVSYDAPSQAKAQQRDMKGCDVIDAETGQPETVARLANPRKFYIRCRIPVSFFVYGKEEISPYVDGVEDKGLQYLQKQAVTYSAALVKEDGIPYSDDLHIPDACPEPDTLICAYALPLIPSAAPSDGSADVTFDVDVIIIYLTADGAPASYKGAFTVSHTVDAEKISSDSVCRACVYITKTSCDLTTDGAAQLRTAEIDLTYDIEILYETPENGTYVADMYSTEFESSTVRCDLPLRQIYPVYTGHFTVTGETDDPDGGSVLVATAECSEPVISDENGSPQLSGNIEINMIRENQSGLFASDTTVPYRVTLPCRIADDAEVSVTVAPAVPSVRADAGRLLSDTELYVRVCSTSEQRGEAVSAVHISDTPLQKSTASLRLYRTEPGEELWDAAKKFRVPADELKAANAGNGGPVIIIP